ncbi:hypothetical protein DNTS_012490 [Danionella cerebrum]|uniref:Immunoglobulin domain-containing protein n=1 Tax=Danionella cerebrum TaxID=2873325 RepID=A0A553QZX7_9TELE|nr:hypothetical protein DNTS_012490 [Danionella translucida]
MNLGASGVVLIFICQSISGQAVVKNEGDQVSFCPKTIFEPIISLKWMHKDTSGKTKVIEWDSRNPEYFSIPNPRYKEISSLDVEIGELTLKNVSVDHSGEYIFELNGQYWDTFSLTVISKVGKSITVWIFLAIILVLIAGCAFCWIRKIC